MAVHAQYAAHAFLHDPRAINRFVSYSPNPLLSSLAVLLFIPILDETASRFLTRLCRVP
jgi:hypothetical protein